MPNSVDLSGIWGQTTTPTETNAPASPSAVDLSSIWGEQKSSPAVPATAPAATDLSSIWGGSSVRPDNGQLSDPAQHIYQDSSQPWYKRAWDFANTPLTESLFGLPEYRPGAGGLERAVEHIASGFTSPLSVALTAATFGTGGLITSAGETALKEAGLSATEIADAVKGSQAALGALKEAKSVDPVIQQALEAGGHDMGLLDRARETFGSLNRDAELATDRVQSNLAKVGLDQKQVEALRSGELSAAERSEIAAKNGGFSDDELKALADTGETVAKAKAGFNPVEDAVREAGGEPALVAWRKAQDELAKRGLNEEDDLLGGNALTRGAFHIIRTTVPGIPMAEAAKVAKTANTVLNAGFTLQQFETAAAMSPRFLDALKEGDTDKAWEYGTEAAISGGFGLLGTPHALHAAGELFDPLLQTKLKPSDEGLAINRAFGEKDVQFGTAEQIALNLHTDINKALGHAPARPILGDTPEVKYQKALERESVYHQVVTGGDKNKAAAWYNAWAEAAGEENRLPVKDGPDNGLPENLADILARNKFKDQSPEYKKLALESMRRVAAGELSDRELEAAELVRKEQAKTFEQGQANDVLHEHLENYMAGIYKDENPDGKIILSNSKAGKFATNVTAARQKVYDSHATAMLLSPKEMDFDVANNVAQGRANMIKAAANRQFIDTLRDNNTRGSDGRPAVVLPGQGKVVSGPNGEDPKTFIDPTRVRKINVAQSVVNHMRQTGDLDRFLEDGNIKDITPYVYPKIIDTAISRLEDQAGKQEAKYDPEGNNILRQQMETLKHMKETGDYSGLQEFNNALKKQYAWTPQGYIALDRDAIKGWNFVTNDAAGNQILVNSDILVHPEFAEYMKNRLGLEQGALSKTSIGRKILGTGSALKQTLLSLSPFHLVQLGLRGIMTGVNPFTLHGPDIIEGAKIDPSDPHSETKIAAMVRHNLTTGIDYKGQQQFSEGTASGEHSLLRLVPGVGNLLANTMQYQTDFIFKRFLPAIKATAAEKLFDDYRAKYPDWSDDRVARAAATHANNSFGGINWAAMGRSASSQEFARAVLLAPDWLESELRSGARLFNKDEGGVGRRQVAIMAGSMWLMARVLNKLTTGDTHQEAPFSLATKSKDGKETLWSIRVLPTDLLHAASDPVGFIKGRLSPTGHMGQEVLSGRDSFGRKLAPEDLWVDIAHQMMPIPVQSIGQALTGTGPEVGNLGQLWKATGGTARTYQTPAQKMAVEMASNHNEDGIVDPAQQQRHRLVMDMEDRVRTGEMSFPDLLKLTYQTDQLTEAELKKIQTNLQKTKGMDSSMASLYTRASRLPAKEYLQLLDTANPSEKTALVPLTIQVQRKYLTKAKKEMTPEERQRDPVFQRLLRTIPGREETAPQPQSQAVPSPVVSPAVQKEVAYLYTATHPDTGHRVGSNDGRTWFDHQTGEPING